MAAILQYRPSDLYLADRKETMAILKKDTHTPLHICKLGPLIMLMFCGTHGHLASTTYNVGGGTILHMILGLMCGFCSSGLNTCHNVGGGALYFV